MMPGDDLLSHGECHTIIGAERFHYRVRNGIGWFPLAIVTRQTGVSESPEVSRHPVIHSAFRKSLAMPCCRSVQIA